MVSDRPLIDLTILTKPLPELFDELSEEIGLRWKNYLQQAKEFMATRRGRPAILIEVAAQHPLADRLRPGPEFTARLERAIELYGQYKEKGFSVEIYVPGSRHMENNIEDIVSLSAAGIAYLDAKKIPGNILRGEDLSDRYKGMNSNAPLKGIYCSADECLVVANYFKEHDRFGDIVSIVGPNQSRRKELHYLANGVYPTMLPATASEFYHNPAKEINVNIPAVFAAEDPTFQSAEKNSPQVVWRQERMPGFLGLSASPA